MIIEVTQEDIDAGKRRDCYACPIALAMLRDAGLRVKVAAPMMETIYPHEARFIDLPWFVKVFVMHFDRGREVAPFSFELPDVEGQSR